MQETQETRVQSQGWEDPLEEGMATHSSILVWRIPWTEEPGRLWSIGSKSQIRLKQLSMHSGLGRCSGTIQAFSAPFLSTGDPCLLGPQKFSFCSGSASGPQSPSSQHDLLSQCVDHWVLGWPGLWRIPPGLKFSDWWGSLTDTEKAGVPPTNPTSKAPLLCASLCGLHFIDITPDNWLSPHE